MDSLSGHVMTLANSIIGVSILAMPYCFKQCGIILSIVMLLISSIISRLACHFLLKSAILARRKTFEFLAFHIFGGMGKFIIEIGMIGFLLGTCIAFFVVMGDLTPEIIAEITGTHTTTTMRTSILMALALFAVLPLGLLRKVDSLNAVSSATIGFYCCLVMKVVSEAIPHIVLGDWYPNVNLWRTEGILQCLPIFSMALFCQTQLFEIYQALQNATLEKMNNLVREAVNICTCVYILVGTFGYIAFADINFTGNILLSFPASILSDAMKLGFVVSVVFSFPLVIFPCRASLYSLLYKEGYTSLHEASSNYISEGKFKALTMLIVFVSLVIGIMIPNIELALGLIGSTIGVIICVIFPVTSFICISAKNTNERILAQIMLLVGLTVMVLGTYKNLYSLEQVQNIAVAINTPKSIEIDNSVNKIDFINALPTTIKVIEIKTEKNPLKVTELIKEVRHEPPQPVEPVEEDQKLKAKEVLPVKKLIQDKIPNEPKSMNDTKIEEVDIEAIKKQDKEEALQLENEVVRENPNEALLDTIKKQNEVQKEIVEQQKKLIEVIQSQQKINENNEKDKVNEEKLRAVKEIKNIALRAIEKISGKEEAGKPDVSEHAIENNLKHNNLVDDNKMPNNNAGNADIPIVAGDNSNLFANIQKEVDKVVNDLKSEGKNLEEKKLDTPNNPTSKPPIVNNIKSDDKIFKEIKLEFPNIALNNSKTNGNVHQNIIAKDTIERQTISVEKVETLKIKELKNPISQTINGGLNSNVAVNTKSNDTAPLLSNLGKVKETINSKDTIQLLPLPLVIYNNSHQNLTSDTVAKVTPEVVKVPLTNDKDNSLDSKRGQIAETQAIRRDILGFTSD